MADSLTKTRDIMDMVREHFIKNPRDAIPPIAYVITVKGDLTMVPSVGGAAFLKAAFYDRIRMHTKSVETAAICVIGLANMTHESGKRFEVFLCQYQSRSGERKMWYARVTRSPLRTYVGPWYEPDDDVNITMLDRENFFSNVN